MSRISISLEYTNKQVNIFLNTCKIKNNCVIPIKNDLNRAVRFEYQIKKKISHRSGKNLCA